MKLGIVCGGASAERGVSINSARSVMDHLKSDDIEIVPFYFDVFMNAYRLSTAQLYSNTPSDFDFKLRSSAKRLTRIELVDALKEVDIVFPLIHGIFGEDGQIQQFFEDNDIPYIGGSAKAYRAAFPKDIANSILSRNGFVSLPFVTLNRRELDVAKQLSKSFFSEHKLKRAIVKPVLGGSSIGVFDVHSPDEVVKALKESIETDLFVGDLFILEPFCHGHEFTSIVVQNEQGKAVSFVPTEVEVVKGSEIFNFRKKYLPTDATLLHCPPHFTDKQIKQIQKDGERIFELFGINDYLRLDGWLLEDGRILFSDINTITGMEQCSFVFEQTSRVGFTHTSILRHILKNACRRYGIDFDPDSKSKRGNKKKKVFVLMGGRTAERQVSLMSGTNVWLKLLKSKKYEAMPFLVDKHFEVWSLPYTFTLNHTVEEIYLNCIESQVIIERLAPYANEIYKKLGFKQKFDVKKNTPVKMSLDDFCKLAQEEDAFVFIGLHGGEGENGSLQNKLESYGLVYNGSNSDGSRLCMDKVETGKAVNAMKDPDIYSLPKKKFNIRTVTEEELNAIWDEVSQNKEFDSFAIKPLSDGCSSGIIRIFNLDELKHYVEIASDVNNEVIPAKTFHGQLNEVSLPQDRNPIYFIEPFVPVDYIRVVKNDIVYKQKSGWLEFTVGVLEKGGKYHSLNPSITIAEGEVLSLEEKFQGGTGVNITPPPSDILKSEFLIKAKAGNEKVAKALGIKSYARIDIFFNVITGKLIVIEANTLPGMTPSTVIYHQALAEVPSMMPLDFIERIIDEKISSSGC